MGALGNLIEKKVLNGKPCDSIVNYFTVNVSPQTTKTT